MTLLAAMVGLALADSLNPTSISMAGYLATGARRRDLYLFVFAVFITYLGVALLLTMGVAPAVHQVLRQASTTVMPALELAVGLVLMARGVRVWVAWSRQQLHTSPGARPALALGVAATAMDLPTAAPLFVAAGLIVTARLDTGTTLALLLGYDLLYVAPLLAIAGVRALAAIRSRMRRPAFPGVTHIKPVLLAGVPITVGCALGGHALAVLA